MSCSDRAKLAKAQLELYKSNILEKEAYAIQDVYKKTNITNSPDIGVSAIENHFR